MGKTVAKVDAQGVLAGILREEAKAAAGKNLLVSKSEQAGISDFSQVDADRLREKHGRVRVDKLVDAGMRRAMRKWAKYNPPGTRDGRTLAKDEVHAIGKSDPALGALTLRSYELVRGQNAPMPDLTLTTTHPGLTLVRGGDAYVLRAVTGSAGFGVKAQLHFDGHTVELQSDVQGRVHAYPLPQLVPEGYGAKALGGETVDGVFEERLVIQRDPAGSLTSAQALSIARQALLTYVRDVRRHEPDWTGNLALPTDWEGLVAAGILDGINRFPEGTSPRGDTPVYREQDHYVFVGSGPFNLYTEVAVRKSDGKVLKTFVEID